MKVNLPALLRLAAALEGILIAAENTGYFPWLPLFESDFYQGAILLMASYFIYELLRAVQDLLRNDDDDDNSPSNKETEKSTEHLPNDREKR